MLESNTYPASSDYSELPEYLEYLLYPEYLITMMNFEYRSLPAKVIFGSGKWRELPRHLSSYSKVMIIASDRLQPLTAHMVKELGAGRVSVFSRIAQHAPQDIVNEAAELAGEFRPDILLAMGGGSAIGLAKAVSITRAKMQFDEQQLPQQPSYRPHARMSIVAMPTTFSGSEQTDIWGISTSGVKNTGRSDRVLPSLVVYDPELFEVMPAGLAVTSAMNAMAHLIEAVYAPDGNPLTSGQALQGIRWMKKGLMRLADRPSHSLAETPLSIPAEIAELLLFGAFLAGKSLREVSMSLQHKTAHVLGGSFGLDHATVHTVLLPYVLRYQWPHLDADIRQDLEQVLGPDPAEELRDLTKNAGGPVDLNSIGFNKADIPGAVDSILSKPYGNPAPLEKDRMIRMLENAWNGSLQSRGL